MRYGRGVTAAFFAALAMASSGSLALAQSDWSSCSSGEPVRIIQGCTAILSPGNKIPATQRALAYVNRGIAYYDRGELDKARADYTAAIRLDPKRTEAFHNRADLELRLGEIEAAIVDYTQVITLDPKYGSAYNGRGNALRESGQIDRAIADYNQAIKIDPRSPFAFNGRGNALRDKGQIDAAISDYNQAITLNPKYTTALIGRANAFSDKGRWQDAIKDYDTAIGFDPKDATAYNNRGTARQNLGDLARAIDDYTLALGLDPARAAFYFNRALAYHRKGEPERALADYSATIERDSNYAYAYHNRGLLYHAKGDFERAIADFTKAIEINPQYAQSYLSRGMANLRGGDVRNAIDDLRQSLRIDDRQPAASAALGEAYAKLRLYEDARTQFDHAIALDPTFSEAFLQRARLFEAQGEFGLASKDYAAALALDPQLAGAKEALQAAAERAKTVRLDKPATTEGRLNRVALVIGNSAYASVAHLPNARRDAATVADAFRKIGFRQVIQVSEQTRESMLAALRRFRELADTAEWAVIYYAGHGIEIDGVNYLVPVDARLATDRDVPDEAVPLPRVLDSIDHAKQLRLVVLDACRDNPFLNQIKRSYATRSIGRGLARVEPEGSILVAYAAKHGQIAMDGKGDNSPFVTSLVRRILTPGLEIRKMFGLVRDDVLAATGKQQEPFVYGTLGGDDFIFNPN